MEDACGVGGVVVSVSDVVVDVASTMLVVVVASSGRTVVVVSDSVVVAGTVKSDRSGKPDRSGIDDSVIGTAVVVDVVVESFPRLREERSERPENRLFSSSSTLTGCLVGLGVTGIGVGLGLTGAAVGLTVGGATSASNNVHSLTPLTKHQISSVYPSAMAACFTSSGNSHQSYYSQSGTIRNKKYNIDINISISNTT